jgi:hypothetical protein
MPQIEMSAPLSALDDTGRPVNFGWARSPVFQYNSALIRRGVAGIAESDRYIIFSPTHLLILEVLDGGYLGYIGISVISLKDKKRSTQYYIIPFSMGSFELPGSSETGSIRIQQKKSLIDFIVMDGGIRILKVDVPKFGRYRYLRGEVVLSPPPAAESLVTHMPWRQGQTALCLSRRSPWYIAEGVMQFGTTELIFTRGNAWGIFDWNRGLRPRSDVRYWASACGPGEGGQQAGFSVGYGSADASMGTENAFFVDGKLHKLDQVTFHISPSSWLLPWRFTSNDNRLEMTFNPHQERFENNRMFFHTLRRRQVIGSFSGRVVLDGGRELRFQDITGVAERRKTRF